MFTDLVNKVKLLKKLITNFVRNHVHKIGDNMLLIFSMNQTQSKSVSGVGGGMVVITMTY